jgi:hypothetical protein
MREKKEKRVSIIKFAVENDGVRVKSDYDNFGFAQFVAQSGKRVFLAHAYSDAELEVEPPDNADLVICCHPGPVARKTGFPTVGDWDGETRILFYTKHVCVLEK